jgi:hypothetical protein
MTEYTYVNEKLVTDVSETLSDTTILMMEKETVSETLNVSSKLTRLIVRKDFFIYIYSSPAHLNTCPAHHDSHKSASINHEQLKKQKQK